MNSFQTAWGLGFFGVLFSLMMFGISFGQVTSYFCSFPNDRRSLKLTIGTMFILDCTHVIGLLGTFWRALVTCRSVTGSCSVPYGWESLIAFVGTYFLNQSAQIFYVHRVWIISGKNKLVTGTIVAIAVSQQLLGFVGVQVVLKSGDWQAMYNSPYPALAAGASSVCDLLITISIAYFLRSRSKMYKQENYIRQLKIVFLEMGMLSFIASVLVTIALSLPSSKARLAWVPAPGPVLTQIYFNSVLSVLNTRKVVRQRHIAALGQMCEVRTLGTSTLNS